MSPRSFALFLAAVLNGALALYLFWRYREQRIHRYLALVVLSIAAYGLFTGGLFSAETEEDAIAWIRLASWLSYLSAIAFFAFTRVFTQMESARWTRWLFWAAVLACVADGAGRLGGLFQVSLRHTAQGWFPAQDVAYSFLYTPVMVTLYLASFGLLIWRRRQSRLAIERVQISYIFLAVGVAFLLSAFNIIPEASALAAFSPLAFTLILSYGITRGRFLELRLLLRQGAAAALVGLVLSAGLAALLLFQVRTLDPRGHGWTFAALVGGLSFALLQPALQRAIAKLLSRWLGEPLDVGKRLLAYSLMANQTQTLDEFLRRCLERLAAESGLERVGLLLPDRQGYLRPYLAHPPQEEGNEGIAADGAVAQALLASVDGLEFDSLGWTRRFERDQQDRDLGLVGEIRALMRGLGAQAMFGLHGRKQLLGVLYLGPPKSGRALGQEELSFFGVMAGQLATTIDAMALHGKMQHVDRLSLLGTMAASLAHELRNPLASISSFVQMLPGRQADPAFLKKFSSIVPAEIDKLVGLTSQLLGMARPATKAPRTVDLGLLCKRLSSLINYEFKKKQVRLVLDVQEGLLVQGVEEELSQVVLNLCINALEVSPPGGRVLLHTGQSGEAVQLKVLDQGPGLDEQVSKRLFEPFFTTKEHGHGLGLVTSRRLAESVGGSLSAGNAPEKGAVFTLTLPALKQS